jgi:serine/threonine protein kinase
MKFALTICLLNRAKSRDTLNPVANGDTMPRMSNDDILIALRPTIPDLDERYARFLAESTEQDGEALIRALHTEGVITPDGVVALEALFGRASGTLDGQPSLTVPNDTLATPANVAPGAPEAGAEASPFAEDEERDQPVVMSREALTEGAPKAAVAESDSASSAGGTGAQRAVRRADAAPGRRRPSGGPPSLPPGVKTASPVEGGDRRRSRAPTLPEGEGSDTSGMPGDVPGRGYQFIGKIGEGAMGEILIAKDRDLHRTIAYKVMSASIADNPSLSGKFYGEAQIMAQLDHPNICPVYALDRSRNTSLSITMKLIRGKTFEKFLEEVKASYKAKKIPEQHSLNTRLDMFLRVLDAMYYAHSRGVIHRDLKPENVMVGAYGEVYVMDWGIARLWSPEGARREDLVLVEGYQEDEAPPSEDDGEEKDPNQGVIIGTPQYMSPEQAHGRKDIDPRSDQYALGLILYELVSLNQAVTGKSPIKIVMRQQDAEKNPLQHMFGEAIPPELRAIVEKSTMKDKTKRYESVQAMAEDIKRYLRGEAVLAKPDTTRQAVARWVGRNRELTLAMVLLFFGITALTVVGAVGISVYNSYQAQQREQRLANLVTSVGAQASLIDSQFARLQGLLGIVAASSSEMLIRGAPSSEPYYTEDMFADAAARPNNMLPSKQYKADVSLEHPVVSFVEPKRPSDEIPIRQIEPMQRYLKRVMLLSENEQAASFTEKRAEQQILDKGVPLAWIAIALKEGQFMSFPGRAGLPDKFDARKLPWYKLAEKAKGTKWGAPYVDVLNRGAVLPCATPLFDDSEKIRGIATILLPFTYIISDLLDVDSLPPDAEAFLVNEDGQVVVRSSQLDIKYDARPGAPLRLAEFQNEDILLAIKDRDPGSYVKAVSDDGERELILYNRMNSLGWYYIVRGPEVSLLESAR